MNSSKRFPRFDELDGIEEKPGFRFLGAGAFFRAAEKKRRKKESKEKGDGGASPEPSDEDVDADFRATLADALRVDGESAAASFALSLATCVVGTHDKANTDMHLKARAASERAIVRGMAFTNRDAPPFS